MELDIKDRLVISSILPEKGDMTTMLISKDLGNKINLTQEEITAVGFTINENGTVSWKQEGLISDINLTSAEINLLKDAVSKLDAGKEITAEKLDICIKIKALGV